MATFDVILQEFRAAIAAVKLTRDPSKYFLEHKGNDDFEASPSRAGTETFYVEYAGDQLLSAFGVQGARMKEGRVLVKVGHPPYSTQGHREDLVARDVERLADILESRAWTTAGIDAVFFEGPATVSKQNAKCWISGLTFRVIFTGPVAS